MKTMLGLVAAALILSSAPAIAQAPPGGVPLGAGLQRGVMSLNNSGQTGFVTLFEHGKMTHVVTSLEGTLPGRKQTVAIQRGKTCDAITNGIVARSADMVHGMSRGDVMMAQSRLLSGNYVVVVYSNNTPGARPVACGQLYQ
jgi:hypothetical protein